MARLTAIGALLLLLPCIWDSDTIDDEMRGLPDAYALISGRWFRHGDVYYRHRIATLPAHLEKNPGDLGAYDDLAVAFERLEQRDKAVAVMRRKARALEQDPDPEHRYRYHANLGTFFAHSGRFEEAVAELEKAIQINPDAHFGRERIQIDLIRYVAAAKKDPSLWKEHTFFSWAGYTILSDDPRIGHSPVGRSAVNRIPVVYPAGQKGPRFVTWVQAYDGVLGMLRFGGLEGAELYRLLGELFALRGDLNFAWWAYRWALTREHPDADRLRGIAGSIRGYLEKSGSFTGGFEEVEANAAEWLANFHKAEEAALQRGERPGDPAVLERLIAEADASTPASPLEPGSGLRGSIMIGAGALAVALIVISVVMMRRRRLKTVD